MNRILDRLWIGDTDDFRSSSGLKEAGFVGVVDLRDHIPDGTTISPCINTYNVKNADGAAWLNEQVNEVLTFIHRNIFSGRILVACAAGRSRSASICIAYLVRCGWDKASAYEQVRKARYEISPHPEMLHSALNCASCSD